MFSKILVMAFMFDTEWTLYRSGPSTTQQGGDNILLTVYSDFLLNLSGIQLKCSSAVAAPPNRLPLTHTHNSVPAGGGVTLRGSDGQLHPRAPPKPLRVSAVFPNAIPPPPTDRDYDPSSFYDELVVQVKNSSQITHSSIMFICHLSVYLGKRGRPDRRSVNPPWRVYVHLLLCPGATVRAEGSRGPTTCRGKVAEPRPPNRDFLWLSGGTEQRSITTSAVAAAEEDGTGSGRLAF